MTYVYLCTILAALSSILLTHRAQSETRYRLFLLLLSAVFLIETTLLAVFPALHFSGKWRNPIYNVLGSLEMLFYCYLLSKEDQFRWVRRLQQLFLIFFPLIWFLLIYFGGGIMAFHGSIFAVGGFFVVLFAQATLFRLGADLDRYGVSRAPVFWICIGLIIFYSCLTPYMGAMSYLVKYHLGLAVRLINVSLVLNSVMYCLFAYAFYCLRNQAKKM